MVFYKTVATFNTNNHPYSVEIMNAIVTGATRGIGKAIALELASKGAYLALTARDENDLYDLSIELKEIYPECEVMYKACDLTDQVSTQSFISMVQENWQHIEILVNNFGTYNEGEIFDASFLEIQNQLNANFYSAFQVTQAFLPWFTSQHFGHIFNVCSIVAKQPRKEAAAYTIAKTALKSYNDVLRESLREYDVKVTAIIPGSTNTSSWDGIDAPLHNMIQARDIGKSVMYAYRLSPAALAEEIVLQPIDSAV